MIELPDSGKPFHELTRGEYDKLAGSGMTYEELARQHPQPEWCGYPNAVYGHAGCWSLVTFGEYGKRITGRESCKGCDCYVED